MSRRPVFCLHMLLLLAASTGVCLGVPWPPGTEPRPAAPSAALLARIEQARAARAAAVRPVGIAPHPGGTEQGARSEDQGAKGAKGAAGAGVGYLRVTPRDKAATTDPGKVTYAYDVNGNLTSMEIPLLGRTVTYAYDNLDRLATLTDGPGKVYTFAHDALGRRTSLSRPNGVVTGYAYDQASQVTSIQHLAGTGKLAVAPSGVLSQDGGRPSVRADGPADAGKASLRTSVLEKAEYTYTTQGLRDSLATLSGVQQFTYDDTGQITSANYPDRPADAFSYDAVGNHTADGQRVDAANRLLEDSQYTYTYDANGNLTRKTAKAGGAVTTYAWDEQDRLTSVTLPGGQTTRFTYRFDGKRTSRTDSRGEVRFLYTGLDIFAITDAAGAVLSDFTYGPGIDEPLALRSAGAEYAYLADALGSIQALVDTTGAVVERYDYSAFGQTRIRDATGTVLADSALGNPYGFTAREMENGVGMYYYRARWYAPGVARFASEDRLLLPEPTLNLARYARNNPTLLGDSSRADPTDEGTLTRQRDAFDHCLQDYAAYVRKGLPAHLVEFPDELRVHMMAKQIEEERMLRTCHEIRPPDAPRKTPAAFRNLPAPFERGVAVGVRG